MYFKYIKHFLSCLSLLMCCLFPVPHERLLYATVWKKTNSLELLYFKKPINTNLLLAGPVIYAACCARMSVDLD